MTARQQQVVVRLTMIPGAAHTLLNANHYLSTVNVANLESDDFRDAQPSRSGWYGGCFLLRRLRTRAPPRD